MKSLKTMMISKFSYQCEVGLGDMDRMKYHNIFDQILLSILPQYCRDDHWCYHKNINRMIFLEKYDQGDIMT